MMKPLGDINTSKLNTGVGLFKQGETKAFILQANDFDSAAFFFFFFNISTSIVADVCI